MRKPVVIVNSLHKWLALLVGAQVIAWLLTGAYMVLVDIDFIHGDPLVRNMQQTLDHEVVDSLNLAELRADYPEAIEINIKPVLGRSYYTVITHEGRYLIDASAGRVVSPLGEEMAMEIAKYHYNGSAPIVKTALITTDAPPEIGTRALPLWRVDFKDRFATSFYIDPYSGSLVTRRHRYWRIFDFFWMLHIMDYDDRSDIHHPLLWSAQVAGLILSLTGTWLLIHRLGRRKKRRKPGPT